MLRTMYRILQAKYMIFVLLAALSFAVIGEAYYVLILSNQKSMTVSFNYSGAELGLNPDGSRFNISELTNDEILNEAKAGLELEKSDNADIRSRLFITTKFSQKAMENVVSDIKDGMQGSFVPTTFYVYYSQKNKLAKNETAKFLTALAESYGKYFDRAHAENNSVLSYNPGDLSLEDYDYSEIYTILYNKADEMLNLIKKHQSENRSFRSEDKLNFGTVKDELANFRDVKLEKFNAYVVQNSISKNRPEFINKLSYLIDKNTITYNKNMQASEITKNALKKYDPQITAVAFVPSVDNSYSYYMSRTKTGIDDLAKDSYGEGMDAARIAQKLDGYKNKLTKLKGAKNTDEETLAAADGFLAELQNDLKNLSEKIVKLDDSYLEYKTERYYSYKVADDSGAVSLPVMVKFMIFGIILAAATVLYTEFLHKTVRTHASGARRAFSVMSKIKR